MEKLIIYRDHAGLKVTPQNNYYGMWHDERKVTDCSAFNNADEVIDYMCKWCNCHQSDFTVFAHD